MKYLYYTLLALCISCTTFSNNELTFEEIQLVRNSSDIDPDTTLNFELDIQYLRPTAGQTNLVDSINLATRQLLAAWFNPSQEADFGLVAQSTTLMTDFIAKVKRQPNEDCFTCRVFNLKINVEQVFKTNDLINIVYMWYFFDGGAHGNYARKSLIFDKKTGEQISIKSLLKNYDKVEQLAEKQFRSDIGLSEGSDLSDMYQFENNKFQLSKQFALSENGLVFFYNPYEIAPYSAGIIEITLPYNQLTDCLNYTIQP